MSATPCAQVCSSVRIDMHCHLSYINPGPEHSGMADTPGHVSYCTLPMFHQPANIYEPSEGVGYTSNDGHIFECRNPVELQQAFHVYVY